ncbi:D-alanyl-D-alanine carboxypeptidase family protein [Rhodovulum sp. MB263]|uniref:D-alanyl-D-alanine carboxypeptidase family protein n=1 Tax=Rhodovulum sp. (strain MB263) TaxID=308754 RepID=UPI0009B783AB|nr:D-alanyl-D-alanine carboxypeptidase family protein [Rhodovulum sp. MB263]ARC87620.1 D-alanyl-D-alanine carboxypeptidase [Rhodovulum sp. MB263]
MTMTASGLRAAPSAAFVVDARTGEVLHAKNADTRLHPASLTKMMTLYIAFEAIEHGEISPETMVKISSHAASEPPSKLGLRAGQRIKFKYLIRAAAIKSANDAATAIGEALEGSEAAFARRMNRTARAMGMNRTTFRNANGLTEEGHLSTARDMTILARHIVYDYPGYYNIFSRTNDDAGIRQVYSTNRRFLGSYSGADGIKTGYTNAAGYNLVGSARRGQERIIATVMGGRSTAARNAEVAKLLDLGFRKAPTRVAMRMPQKPPYLTGPARLAPVPPVGNAPAVALLARSLRPQARPGIPAPSDEMIAALAADVSTAVSAAKAELTVPAAAPAAPEASPAALAASLLPRARPGRAQPPATPENAPAGAPSQIAAAAADTPPTLELASADATLQTEIVSRLSSSGGRYWGINVGNYGSRYQAERVLLRTALQEMGILDNALRKVVQGRRGFEANFVGMTEAEADQACRRLQSHGAACNTFGPPS